MRRAAILIGCVGALVLFHGMGTATLPLFDRDEPRFAEAAREMLERSDFIVPYFNNIPRLQKPPLTYWCQILFYRLFGESEWSARLPSVLAASLAALVVFGFGSSLYDRRIGLWAAVVFSLSLHTMILAKTATADMLMVLFVTLASWAGWELSGANKTTRLPFWWVLYYGSLALGFLAKGPVAWLPLVMSVPNRKRGLLGGILLVLALVGIWGIAALVRTNGDFLHVGIGEHVVGRSFEVMDGHGAQGLLFYILTLPYYCVTVFFSFFPWSILLPAAAVHFAKRDEWTANEKYLLSGIVILFVVFSLMRTKLPHYIYPAFPFISILFARFWVAEKGASHRLQRISVIAVLVSVSMGAFLYPRLVGYSASTELFRQSGHLLKPEMEFASADFHEPSLVWNFRKVVRGFHHPLDTAQLPDFMKRSGSRFCILPAAELRLIEHAIDARWPRIRHQGFNVAKGRQTDLVMVVKRE